METCKEISGKHCSLQTHARSSPISEYSRLYKYIMSCRASYLWGCLFLLGANAFALLIPWLLKLAVESLKNPVAVHSPAYFAAWIMGAAVAHGIVRIYSRTHILHAGRRIEYEIREDLFAKLISLDLPYFSGGRTGDILSRFSNDLTNVRMLLGFGIMNVVNTALVYVSAIALMLRISPTLTLYAVVPYPLMILLVKRVSHHIYNHSKRAQEELANLSNQVEENVSAATVVKAYCREDSQLEMFRETGAKYLHYSMKMANLRGILIPFMASVGGLGTLIVLLAGGARVINGDITLGDFVAFNGYLAMLIWPTVVLGWILNLLQRGAASMSRLNAVLDARPEISEPLDPVETEKIVGEIEFRNLTFGYNDTPLLKGLSLQIGKGMRVGIVGPVGSGKTTLMRLIARLYPVEDGQLFIDGIDINRISLKKLRNAIGYVPQESFLFSRTIAENIAYGRQDATSREIEAAARLAHLDGDVSGFPEDYETLVGERGVTLSGGQKQRTAIARALLKSPAILILDDPLSAVDAATEERILDELSGYYGNRTVFIVSHRLSALRDCDLILVLDNGVIREQGTHGKLLDLGGLYAQMHREQQLREEIAGY
jgi:ATP-binding cassette subfamily B multidrug efflux pump